MVAPISVIIPTLNSQAKLPHCLAALSRRSRRWTDYRIDY